MSEAKSFFKRRQKTLGIAVSVYVVMLIYFHWQLPSSHVWVTAAVFSVLMNFTYLTEAISLKSFVRIEALVAISLILASILGLVLSPLLIIAAVFGHGIWDLQKHFGNGVPFFSWYTFSCLTVDTLYSSTLLFYYLIGS